MKKRIVNIGITLLLVISAIVISGFMIKNKPVPQRDVDHHEVLYVKTEAAAASEIHPEAHYRGRVSSLENVNLTAEVSGKILEGDVALKEGQSFKEGDLLLRIYKEDVQASLKSLRSSYLQLVGSALPDLKVDYPEEYEKWSAFFNKIDINSGMPELPEINSEKERVFVASKNILSNYYSIKQQEVNFRRYEIYAPFDGSYKSVNAEVGSVASMNMQIASLIRSDVMEVIVPVLPEKLDWIREGGEVSLKKNNGQVLSGRIGRVAGFIDPASRSVNVYVTVNNQPRAFLLEGEYVEASFRGQETISGMLIPREALVGENKVYVIDGEHLAEKEIRVIERQEDYLLIQGFEEGETLVVESLVDVKSGQLVAALS